MTKVIVALLSVLTLACADRDGGPYIGFGYGIGEFGKNDIYKDLQENRSALWMLYGGAFINKNFSVELGYGDFGRYQLNNAQNLDVYVLGVSTLAHYPFYEDHFDVYAKFGVGQIGLSTISSSGFTYIFGAGFGYRYNEYVGIKLGYDYYPFDYEDAAQTRHGMNIKSFWSAIEVQF